MARFLVPSVFDAGLPTRRTGPTRAVLRMNVSETDQDIRIEAELPGIPPEDVHVELADDALTIRGEKRAERQDAQHHLVERSFGAFARTVHLPFAPDPDRVQANFEHGVLRITVPKSVPQARSRRIPVQSAQAATAQGCLGPEAAAAGHPTSETTQGHGGQKSTGENEGAERAH